VKTALHLLNPPVVNITPFNSIVAPSTVGEIDARRIPPVGKFADLVDIALPLGIDTAYRHLFLTWYFKVPGMICTEISQFDRASEIRLTANQDELMAEGLMSGAFDVWRAFLAWGTTLDRSVWMRELTLAMHKMLASYPYFKMEVVEGKNRILMLRG
jgi:hypothetical protein